MIPKNVALALIRGLQTFRTGLCSSQSVQETGFNFCHQWFEIYLCGAYTYGVAHCYGRIDPGHGRSKDLRWPTRHPPASPGDLDQENTERDNRDSRGKPGHDKLEHVASFAPLCLWPPMSFELASL